MMNAWRYFVVVVLVIIVAHELPAQSGPRLDPMMAGDNTVSLTVPRTDYILSRLAPESKLFESDSGRIIFDRSGYWFFLNLDENVIVQIENKSARWKRFLERVLFVDTPGRVYRSLTTELEYNLSAQEEQAVIALIEALHAIFCYLPIEEIDAMSKSMEQTAVDLESIRSEAELKEQERRREILSERYDPDRLPQEGKLIFYDDELIVLDVENEVIFVVMLSCDQHSARRITDLIRAKRYDGLTVRTFETPASVYYSATDIGGVRYPDPDFKIPQDSLMARGIFPKAADLDREPQQPQGGGRQANVAQWEEQSFQVQFCPMELKDTDAGYRPPSSVVILDDGIGDDLNSWIIIADRSCYKCGGVETGSEVQIIAPALDQPLQVDSIVTDSAGLASPILQSVSLAISLRRKGTITVNRLRTIGETGFTFMSDAGDPVLVTGEHRVEHSGGFDRAAFDKWYARWKSKTVHRFDVSDTELVARIFDMCASNWEDFFKQDPLAHLRRELTIVGLE